MNSIDPRVVRVGIEVGGKLRWYEGLDIRATGTKYDNATQNECTVTISNLAKDVRDQILTETSPFLKPEARKRLILQAGRQSYGVKQIFVGEVFASSISQPPDIAITLKTATGATKNLEVVSISQPAMTSLSSIAKQVGKDLGVGVRFEASDKKIANYSFAGSPTKQIQKLAEAGNVDAFLDDETLVVKDSNRGVGNRVKVLNLETGMIGVPEFTEVGVKVKYLLDADSAIGGLLKITSILNPALNGTYIIYKLSFEIASRDTPFYYVAEAKRA